MAHETLENGKAQTCYIEIAYRNMHKEKTILQMVIST